MTTASSTAPAAAPSRAAQPRHASPRQANPRPARPLTTFFLQFLANPGMLGSFTPSSAHFAEEMVKTLDFHPGARIAEYGAGTGAFTKLILERMHTSSTFFTIERNPALAEQLRLRFPNLHIHIASAEEVDRLCQLESVEQLDAVVCGLPWASFPESLQIKLLEATARVLRPGGQLITCGYPLGLMLPAGRRFYKLLPRFFASIQSSGLVFRNWPPGFVVRCRKPGTPPPSH
jgi:phosphatidylethanolamine/phosphatidyl-N-methylethanolamine N-methyltransferase